MSASGEQPVPRGSGDRGDRGVTDAPLDRDREELPANLLGLPDEV